MSSEELQELHEHAEHGKHHPSMAPVSLTMAVLAVIVAVVSLLGHRAHTEEVLLQNEISDGWAHYQVKSIRRNTDQMFVDLVSLVTSRSSNQATILQKRYQAETIRYASEQKELEAETRKLERKKDDQIRRANRYDLGEVFVEIALVITSITLLSGRRKFWLMGILLGVVGAVIAAYGLL